MQYPWPVLDGPSRPEWTGSGFLVGGRRVAVLSYSGGQSGWSDGLTHQHEMWAGADHPIDQMSRRWTTSALRRHLADPHATLLEVGCSSGFLIRALLAEWPSAMVMGSDFLREPLERLAAREPGIPLLQFDLVQCPLPDASIDAVVMLNVLEHIGDDRAAMRQIGAQSGSPAESWSSRSPRDRTYTMRTTNTFSISGATRRGRSRQLLEGSGLDVVERRISA